MFLKLLLRNFNMLYRTLKSIVLRPITIFRYKLSSITNIGRVLNQIPKFFASLLSKLKLKPEKREDYVDAGKVYIAKSLIIILAILIIALPLLIYYFAWPWTVSTFLTAKFYEGQPKLESYSGRVKIYYEKKLENLEFAGRLKKGRYTGAGKEFYVNGMPKYSGSYADGKYDGEGILYSKDGKRLYKGSFKAGVYSGRGELLLTDGSVYKGDFKGGKRNGTGQILKDGKLVYEGDMADDKKSGKGRQYYNSGKLSYDGAFAEDACEGEGTEYYPSGKTKYQGSFKTGMYSGKGLMYDEKGRLLYEGGFERGLYNGTGRYYGNKGELSYAGAFVNGLFDGEGKLITLKNKNWYEGSFLAGKANGDGKLYRDGKLYYQGSFVDDQMSGNGTLADADSGVTYTGAFENNDIAYGQLFNQKVADIYTAFSKGFTEDTSREDSFFLYNTAFGAVLKFSYATENEDPKLAAAFILPSKGRSRTVGSAEDLKLQGTFKFARPDTSAPSADAGLYLPVKQKRMKCYRALYKEYQVRYWTDANTGALALIEYAPYSGSPAGGVKSAANAGNKGNSENGSNGDNGKNTNTTGSAPGKTTANGNAAAAVGTAADSAQAERCAACFADLGLDMSDFASLGYKPAATAKADGKASVKAPVKTSVKAGGKVSVKAATAAAGKKAGAARQFTLEQASAAARRKNSSVTDAASVNALVLSVADTVIDLDLYGKQILYLEQQKKLMDKKAEKAATDFKTGKINAAVCDELNKKISKNKFDLNYYKMQADNAKKNYQRLVGTPVPKALNYNDAYLIVDAGALSLPASALKQANAAELEKKLGDAVASYGKLGDFLSAYIDAKEKLNTAKSDFKTGKTDASVVETAAADADNARMDALEGRAEYSRLLYELDSSLQGYLSMKVAKRKESIFVKQGQTVKAAPTAGVGRT